MSKALILNYSGIFNSIKPTSVYFKIILMKFVVVIILAFLIVIRFLNLAGMPVFIDEQTYLELGESAQNPQNLFLSLKYLVFPITPWILGIFQLIFSSLLSPLYLGRSVMVTTDLIAALFIYLISNRLINSRYAIFCALVYLIIPLNFFHSRIVLLEPVTNMFFLAGLYFYIEFLKLVDITKISNSIPKVLTAAILFSLSFLSKPLALVSFSSLPTVTMFFWINDKKRSGNKLLTYISALMFIFIFMFLLTFPLVFAVWRGYSDYRVSPNLNQVLINLKDNLWLTWWWSKAYITSTLLFALFASLVHAILIREWKILWIFFWLASVIFLESLIGTNYLPRHLFLICAPIAFIIGFLIFKISIRFGKIITVSIIALLFFVPLKINAQIVFNPENAPIALEDKQQFFEDWTSGVGLDEISTQLREISKDREIFVYVESDGGFGWALANLYNTGNSIVIESEQLSDRKSTPVLPRKDNVYVILNREPDPPQGWPLELIEAYPKQTERRYMKIYKYIGT